MRRLGAAAVVVALSAGALGPGAGASVPTGVLTLTGPVTFPRDNGAFNIDATFSYDTKGRTTNGFQRQLHLPRQTGSE